MKATKAIRMASLMKTVNTLKQFGLTRSKLERHLSYIIQAYKLDKDEAVQLINSAFPK